MYESIDKKIASKIIDEVEAVMKKYSAEVGLTLLPIRAKYSNTDIGFNFTLKIEGAKSFDDLKKERDLKQVAAMYNLTTEPKGGFQLVGYNSRKHKDPFIYQNLSNGKRFITCDKRATLMFGNAA